MINKINYNSETRQFTAVVKDACLIFLYYANNKDRNAGNLSYFANWIPKEDIPWYTFKGVNEIFKNKTATIFDIFWVPVNSRPDKEDIDKWINEHLDNL